MRRLGIVVLALAALTALLTGCGGDDEESTVPAQATAARARGPCALVYKSDAEEILRRRTLGEPERQTVGPFKSCIYSDGTLSNYVQVQVGSDVYTLSTFDDAMEAAAEELDIEAERVSGVGDKAYGLAGVLWVQKGDVTLSFEVHMPVDTDLERQGYSEQRQLVVAAMPLASKALERLR